MRSRGSGCLRTSDGLSYSARLVRVWPVTLRMSQKVRAFGSGGKNLGIYDTMTDEELLSRLRAGERDIMDYLMVKYKSMVRRKAREM